jgi:SAM-dependent methyltransferase
VHLSSLDNMRMCLKRHVLPDPVLGVRAPLRVLDVGGADVNGSYRTVFAGLEVDYVVVDLEPGDHVDAVPGAGGRLPFDDESFDLVISGQTFEHAGTFWQTYLEMVRVGREDGLIIVIVPSAGPEHRYPVDCYRFLPDSLVALARLGGTHLIDSWRDPLGPFHDLVGVYRRTPPDPERPTGAPVIDSFEPLQNDYPSNTSDDVEHGAGDETCWSLLERVHEVFEPRFYLEIGVSHGSSLRLARCPALGIDPAPVLVDPLPEHHRISRMTSDDFFSFAEVASEIGPLDLAYIDGMHQVENVLKDFLHLERVCHPASVILIDDIFPAHPVQAQRERASRFWTGDVWKILPILRGARPDLILLPLDTWPCGTLLVAGLDADSDVLWERFDMLVSFALDLMSDVHPEIIQREGALDPSDPLVTRMLRLLRDARLDDDPTPRLAGVRRLLGGAMPRRVAPIS